MSILHTLAVVGGTDGGNEILYFLDEEATLDDAMGLALSTHGEICGDVYIRLIDMQGLWNREDLAPIRPILSQRPELPYGIPVWPVSPAQLRPFPPDPDSLAAHFDRLGFFEREVLGYVAAKLAAAMNGHFFDPHHYTYEAEVQVEPDEAGCPQRLVITLDLDLEAE